LLNIISQVFYGDNIYVNTVKPLGKSRINGENVYLRPLRKNDMKLFTKWNNDPEIMELMAFTKSTTEKYWRKWFEKIIKAPDAIYFGVVKKLNDKLIGFVHLEQIMWSHRLCRDIGIAIGEKGEWSKGYGTEAMKLLIEYAFNVLDLYRLELMTFTYNKRGLKVWKKCGFKKEGVMRKARLVDGEWQDVIFFGLLKDEYGC